jgi:hypothetical protein
MAKKMKSLLRTLRELQAEIQRRAPYRDFGVKPNRGASRSAVAAVERRLGRALPPTYRDFLRAHDGWPRFYDGATLLGSATLGRRTYEDLARATFDAAETPVPDVGPPSRQEPRILIPFGADVQGTTLFVFNPAAPTGGGEYEVIAWVNEIGIRRESFPSFLELIIDLCEAELSELCAAGPVESVASSFGA